MSENEDFFAAPSDGGGEKFHILQPGRGLESNWEVDLARNLEDYLHKICSGEISGEQDNAHHSINFAEAALLLQGSIQVYSRKVEYLYSLVLHALEFLSQKRQDPQENDFNQPGGQSDVDISEQDETFWGLDDVPVEAKSFLDDRLNKDELNQFVRPPANLLVLEGDCLDASGDAGELETYLLATCSFYGDFLLLDPCDAGAVNSFLNADPFEKENTAPYRGSSVRSKSPHSFYPSSTGKSKGAAHLSSPSNDQDAKLNQVPVNSCNFEINNDNQWSAPHGDASFHQDDTWNDREPFPDVRDDSDDDSEDPWKPLNPHEPGNLKIKPFRKGKQNGWQPIRDNKLNFIKSQFPLAKLEGTISPEFAEVMEAQLHEKEQLHASHPPLFEKLRRSLVFGEQEYVSGDNDDGNDDDDDDDGDGTDLPDFGQAEFGFAHKIDSMDVDVPFNHEKHFDSTVDHEGAEAFPHDNVDSNASLEDLCKSHLDALLASIAETEKQTEMASRVSSWKQRIESTLEEQENHPAFDIHYYGERILGKLSLEPDSRGSTSFTNIVMGQSKHEVARAFSALLQLVNNGDVDLQRSQPCDKVICYTSTTPFHVRLLKNSKREEPVIRPGKKRVKSPLKKRGGKSTLSPKETSVPVKSSQHNGRSSVKLAKNSAGKCTPDGKRQRRSRLIDTVDILSAG
ncbi:condensin-2 complex subunit H2 [Dioscorea cayenensis subsp. rotundata]|uniref:Condensin-2 complex subunit H2 n=1 Tax=Dioscorea cayennensis subsp. rotundata TaxID=55577 RepID=A0AB40C8V5_DIOCR|nr:condensin-2 complex subunit H2 [Dioscorea cayenensis subsp. rotundata]